MFVVVLLVLVIVNIRVQVRQDEGGRLTAGTGLEGRGAETPLYQPLLSAL